MAEENINDTASVIEQEETPPADAGGAAEPVQTSEPAPQAPEMITPSASPPETTMSGMTFTPPTSGPAPELTSPPTETIVSEPTPPTVEPAAPEPVSLAANEQVKAEESQPEQSPEIKDSSTIARLLTKAKAKIQERKRKKMEKIMDFLNTGARISNKEARKLARITKRTATRYLEQLEKEQKIIQVGKLGRSVLYEKKP